MLSDIQKRYLLTIARTEIAQTIGANTTLVAPMNSGLEERIQACFVTILSFAGRLRGCIGILESDELLVNNVKRFALAAAFGDPRFHPLTLVEMPGITISISALGPLRRLESFKSVEIGHHGLCVEHNGRRGVLLAKVPVEFGWSLSDFINHTCEKAQLDPDKKTSYRWSYFEEETFGEVHASPK